MTLIKTSLLNGIAVAVRMLTLLGLNKILAVYVGPAGYAALGQFQNAVQMIGALANGAVNTGVTKYTAEYHQDESAQHAVWRTAATLSCLGSLLVAILVILFNHQLAGWFLNDSALGGVFIWFGAAVPFLVLNTFLLAILNGKKEIQRFVFANIAGSIFALVVTSVMAIQFGLYGALVALAVYQSLNFFVTLSLCYKANWFNLRHFFGRIDNTAARNLAKYTAMAVTSAICVPLSHILVRDHLGETLGWAAAGYWEAMWRLSTSYLMLVTTTLSLYYLPKLSELQDLAEIRSELLQGYKIILPVTAGCGFLIYLFRDFIVLTLFSAEFAEMKVLFAWQMVGDTLKIAGWIVAYLMLSKAMLALFVFSEIVFALLFYLLTVTLTKRFGLEGAALAHSVNYLIYWFAMALLVWKTLRAGVVR